MKKKIPTRDLTITPSKHCVTCTCAHINKKCYECYREILPREKTAWRVFRGGGARALCHRDCLENGEFLRV